MEALNTKEAHTDTQTQFKITKRRVTEFSEINRETHPALDGREENIQWDLIRQNKGQLYRAIMSALEVLSYNLYVYEYKTNLMDKRSLITFCFDYMEKQVKVSI